MKYWCEFCKKEYEFEKFQSIGAHKTNCNYNPKRRQIISKISESIGKQKGIERKTFRFNCQKCSNEYTIVLKVTDYKKLKYRKFCSSHCANSRIWTDVGRKNLSLAMKSSKNLYRGGSWKNLSDLEIADKKSRLSSSVKLHWKNHLHPLLGTHHTVSKETKDKISRAVQGKTGGYKIKSGTSRLHGSYYKDVWMDSSWEVKIAEWLDENKIRWIRNTDMVLPYTDKLGKRRKYYPDFYLPDLKFYVDTKNKYLMKLHEYKICQVIKEHNISLLVGDVDDVLTKLKIRIQEKKEQI